MVITDRSIVPYPKTPPDPGHAGSIIVDPFCGNRILRVTDENTNPDSPGNSFVGVGHGGLSPWSCDVRRLVLQDQGKGTYLFDFNPDTLAVRFKKRVNHDYFSHSQPDRLWGVQGEIPRVEQYSISSGGTKVILDLAEYNDALGKPADQRWYWINFAASTTDNRVCGMYGPQQDLCYLALVYDVDQGLSWLNGQTGEYGGWSQGRLEPWTPVMWHYITMTPGGDTVHLGS